MFAVAVGDAESCTQHGHVTLKSQTGYLSSLMTEETGYGTGGCPWRIKAHPGQKVELSVMDFNMLGHLQAIDDPYHEDHSEWCPMSLAVVDESGPKNIDLCNGGQRQRHVYTSAGNQLLAHFVIHEPRQPHYYFLIYFKGK